MDELRSWMMVMGDPGWKAWTVTLGYLLGGGLCAVTALRVLSRPQFRRGAVLLWLATAALMAVLGVNKQFDLHWLLFLGARRLAHVQGWYEQRRLVVAAAAGVSALGAAVVLGGLAWLARGTGWAGRIAITGVVVLLAFALLREFSLGKLDGFFGTGIGGRYRVVEAAGVGLVCLGALWGLLARPGDGRAPARNVHD